MIKNYFKVIYRNLLKNRILSVMNVLGLAIGLAAFLVILMYVSYEKSYDGFHDNANAVYRLNTTVYKEGKLTSQTPRTPCPMGPAIKEKFPEVKEAARIIGWGGGYWEYKNNSIRVADAYKADASFLTIFSFPFVKGSGTALKKPFTLVLSESCAKKLFGDEDPINKSIIFKSRQGDQSHMVTGVFKDLPENSHLKFDMLIAIHDILEWRGWKGVWKQGFHFNLYVLLNPNANPKYLETNINKFLEKEIYQDLSEELIFSLQPLKKIHLYSGHLQKDGKRGSYKVCYYFSIIALFVLFIAWLNYIIITTARSITRAHEVGMRKVVGATKKQLFQQFLLESLAFNFAAAIIALILTQISLSFFNRILNLNLSILMLDNANLTLPLAALFLTGAFLSGLYPALILSSYKPVSILSGKLKSSAGGKILRKILVAFQMAVSVFLIATTLNVYKQVDYMLKQDLGINVDQVILILNPTCFRYNDHIVESGKRFVEELQEYPDIKSVTSSNYPGEPYFSTHLLKLPEKPGTHRIRFCLIDYNFLNTYEPQLIAGRNISNEFSTDSRSSILLNEKAVEMFGFESPQKALNQVLEEKSNKLKIVGVLKNYHQQYLKEEIEPTGFRMWPYSAHTRLSIKINTKKTNQAIELIKAKYEEHFPGYPFEYLFLDEFFDRQYAADRQFGKMIGMFSLLAIFIACIGLWALALFNVSTRTNEIGIRKVHGASAPRVLMLLSKDYINLIALANIIVLPIAYFVAKKWLENYAYHVEIGWWFFVVPIAVILVSSLLTVSYHVFRVARTNPVDSLRYE